MHLHRLAILCALLCLGGKVAAQAQGRILRQCSEIRLLSREEAATAIPVEVTGVVTRIDAGTNGFVVHDDAGVWVYTSKEVRATLLKEPVPAMSVGDVVEISGQSGPGHFASTIWPHRIRIVGRLDLPPAIPVTLAELNTGFHDSQRVSFTGVVQVVERTATYRNEPVLQFTLSSLGGHAFFWHFDLGTDTQAGRYLDAEVKVTGVCGPNFNTRGEIVGVRIQSADASDIEMITPGVADPFKAPLVPVRKISGFHASFDPLHMRRIEGVLTYIEPGQFLYLQDGSRGVRVQTRQEDVFPLGSLIEAAGFIATPHYYAEMEEALLRVKSAGTPPPPTPATLDAIRDVRLGRHGTFVDDYDGRLVTLRGKMVSLQHVPGGPVRLFFEDEGELIRASLPENQPHGMLDDLLPGSELDVTGVCKLTFQRERLMTDRSFSPTSIELLLRDAADVKVVAAASWWTVRRLAIALGVTLVILLLALIWVRVLRHLVHVRGRDLAEETRARRDAEVEFQATQRERSRLAADLHDTMAQTLTGIAMQLEAATDLRPQNAEQSARHLDLARQILSRSREDVQRHVFNLRANPLEDGSLASALQRIADDRSLGLAVEIRVEATGTIPHVPDFIAGNLLLIAQEAITNALKHAAPRHIKLRLSSESNAITLIVENDGSGFDPVQAPGIQQGHFGLQGMRERMKRLGGTLTIESGVGQSTLLTAKAPLDT
ncbi:MAG: sensor histidine kinase [Prosthecobacter sp.]